MEKIWCVLLRQAKGMTEGYGFIEAGFIKFQRF